MQNAFRLKHTFIFANVVWFINHNFSLAGTPPSNIKIVWRHRYHHHYCKFPSQARGRTLSKELCTNSRPYPEFIAPYLYLTRVDPNWTYSNLNVHDQIVTILKNDRGRTPIFWASGLWGSTYLLSLTWTQIQSIYLFCVHFNRSLPSIKGFWVDFWKFYLRIITLR